MDRAAADRGDRARSSRSASLSGGNQQKVALARLLHQQADVLLLDEPTRGIDVGSKAEIYRLLGELAAQGKAILVVSSYLPELFGICDRIAVMSRGTLTEALPVDRVDRARGHGSRHPRPRGRLSATGSEATTSEDHRVVRASRSTIGRPHRQGRSHSGGILGWVWTVFGPFLGLVLITVLFAVLTRESGQFLTVDNWRTIAVQTVIVGTAALGMTIIMIAGGIDLSVGSTVALVTVCMALFMKKVDPSLPESLRAWKLVHADGAAAGGRIGGTVRGDQRGLDRRPAGRAVHHHPGDLPGLSRAGHLAGVEHDGLRPRRRKPGWFSQIVAIEPEPRWLLVAPGVWILLGLSVVLALTLRYSLLGRYAYAIGSNEATARLCGINVPADQGRDLRPRRPGDRPGRRLPVRLPRRRSATRRPPAGSSSR